MARLSPLLLRAGADHATKLRDFVRAFFLIEAEEADLRRALRAASVDLSETEAFRSLVAAGAALVHDFFAEALHDDADRGDLHAVVRFTVLLTTSFAERTTG